MTTVGRYEILEELGKGGFATVYKGLDSTLNRHVAVKILHPYWNEDPDFVKRFQQEAQIAASLRHPNIVNILDTGEYDGRLFIAMEYLTGKTLAEQLTQETQLTSQQTLEILQQLAPAVDYAHGKQVIHRDIKPANISLEYESGVLRVVLMDFGLVKSMDGSSALTSLGAMVGSPEYMAPEQANPDRTTEVGPASDRYALGIVTYQMLTGKVPFSGNTPATLYAHEFKPVPPPRQLNPTIPEGIVPVLLKMLAKEPGERYATAVDFSRAFEQGLEAGRRLPEPEVRIPGPPPDIQETPAEKPETVPESEPDASELTEEESEKKPKKRNRLLLWGCGGLLTVVLGVFACTFGVSLWNEIMDQINGGGGVTPVVPVRDTPTPATGSNQAFLDDYYFAKNVNAALLIPSSFAVAENQGFVYITQSSNELNQSLSGGFTPDGGLLSLSGQFIQNGLTMEENLQQLAIEFSGAGLITVIDGPYSNTTDERTIAYLDYQNNQTGDLLRMFGIKNIKSDYVVIVIIVAPSYNPAAISAYDDIIQSIIVEP